ncbi:unnamed protein product [Auanema sp. JU1783]|nr:unnamed protein product [Auanema sp. JU1783]
MDFDPTAFVGAMQLWANLQYLASLQSRPDLKHELEHDIDEFQTEIECLEQEKKVLKQFLFRLEERVSSLRKKANQKKAQLRRLNKRLDRNPPAN